MKSGKKTLAVLMFAPLIVVSAGWLIAGSRRSLPELPIYGAMPSFALTDQRNQPFSPETVAGRVTVANVVFTRCPTVCPVITLKFKELEKNTRALGDRVAFVSFSVDPEHDTPAVLAAFAKKLGVDSPRFYFVTGPSADLTRRIEEGLKIAIDRRGTDSAGVPDIVHGTHFILFDERGQIRGYYDSSDPDRLASLHTDIARLVRHR